MTLTQTQTRQLKLKKSLVFILYSLDFLLYLRVVITIRIMKNIKVLDKEFEPYISQVEIESAIDRICEQINKDMYDKNPLFLVMLNGAFMFASELLKKLDMDCETSFVKYSTYSGTKSNCEVKELIGLNTGSPPSLLPHTILQQTDSTCSDCHKTIKHCL